MADEANMNDTRDQEFVEYVVKGLVDNPADVSTERTVDEMGVLITLKVNPTDLGQVIGRQGQTLASLEYITRLVVGGQLKSWLPLNVDVAGYKGRRRESLQRLALHLAEQVKLTNRAISMEPMPPDERRIIHLALADHSDATTESVGEGESRKVIISPKLS